MKPRKAYLILEPSEEIRRVVKITDTTIFSDTKQREDEWGLDNIEKRGSRTKGRMK